MNNRLFGIRRHQITNLRAIVGNAKTVDPRLPDGLARRIVIGVALEVIHKQICARGENPKRAR